jgi:hypothetical protein
MASVTSPRPWTRLAHAAAAMTLALAGTACTSYKLAEPSAPVQPWSPAPGGLATVCVVRTSVLALAVAFPIRDNGKLVGATRGPSHFCYYAEPGEHDITVESDTTETAHLVAAPEGRYFLKLEVDNIAGWVRGRPVWVTEDVAREDFDGSIYQVLVGVPGAEQLPGEVPIAPAREERAASLRTPAKG